MSNGNSSLQPTWRGHVATTKDALILFEACLRGTLQHVPRRPHDRERAALIKSGMVYIYEENASGIKRWTDGIPWSPSRILGNFLIYRELTKPFPPGEKKRATKRNKRPSKPGEPYPRPSVDSNSGNNPAMSPTTPDTPSTRSDGGYDDAQRALIGSLVDSYGFKEGGLVKKTMSVNVNGVHHHLVSYYTLEEALNNDLVERTPPTDNSLRGVEPRLDLISKQNFRAPLEECDETMQEHMNPQSISYGFDGNLYDRKNSLYMTAVPPSHSASGMGVSYYPNAYSTATLPNNIPSYTGVFLPPHSMPQVVAKQEEYGTFGRASISGGFDHQSGAMSSVPDRSSYQIQSTGYRHSVPDIHSYRQNGMMMSSQTMQDNNKTLNHIPFNNPVYAPTASSQAASHDVSPTSFAGNSSTFTNGQQWQTATQNHSMPQRAEAMYYPENHQNWSIQNALSARHQNFTGQLQQ
ncbi:hypothetical protein MMC14_000730 [Varicellaria rhodocarpa]|nr:hypothetical protein [Varicellaria rhodocarpa]